MAFIHKAGAGTPWRARLADRWHDWRNQRIRSLEFQRWAAAFPLTRPFARRRALALFDLVAGFVYSQVLVAVVRLRLLETVADGALTPAEIAGRIGLAEGPARRLCAAAASLGLVDARADGRYGLGQLGAALLGNPGVAAMVEHHHLLYDDLRDPVALLREPEAETALSRFWAYARSPAPGRLAEGDVADYSRLMGVSQALVAAEILDAYPLARHRALLDVGGGEGAFICAAARRAPHLAFTLFDLPAVADLARLRFAQAGIGARAAAVGGDLMADDLPAGADLACLIRVLYDHRRDRAVAILRKVRASLSPDGVALVAEPMAALPGAERVGAAYFGFYLLAMHGGEARSPAEIADMMREAGFSAVRGLRTRSPLFTSLVIGRR